jgi:chemosensory pili system protein ChpA (sensor histidine kinase/response regulator)
MSESALQPKELQPAVVPLRTIIADEEIARWKMEFESLDASTSEGYEQVKRAVAVCRKTRSMIEEKRKFLNEEALKHQRTVNAEAKRITGLIEEVEEPLKAKKQAVDDEVERKRKELEEKRRAMIQGRIDDFVKQTGESLPWATAEALSDSEFEFALQLGRLEKQRKDEAEAARIEAERIERERIEAERKAAQEELARLKAEQAAEQKKLREAKAELDRQQEQIERQKAELEASKVATLPAEDPFRVMGSQAVNDRVEAVLAKVEQAPKVETLPAQDPFAKAVEAWAGDESDDQVEPLEGETIDTLLHLGATSIEFQGQQFEVAAEIVEGVQASIEANKERLSVAFKMLKEGAFDLCDSLASKQTEDLLDEAFAIEVAIKNLEAKIFPSR